MSVSSIIPAKGAAQHRAAVDINRVLGYAPALRAATLNSDRAHQMEIPLGRHRCCFLLLY